MTQPVKKVLTIHVKNLRLSPELVAVLGAISEHMGSPDLHTTQDGLVVTVDPWSNYQLLRRR